MSRSWKAIAACWDAHTDKFAFGNSSLRAFQHEMHNAPKTKAEGWRPSWAVGLTLELESAQAATRPAPSPPKFERAVRALFDGADCTLDDAYSDTLASVHSLAELHYSKGEHAKAEPLLVEALKGRRRTLGDAHTDTLTSANNLGMLHSMKGEHTKAEALLVEALKGRRRTLGDAHTDTLALVANLAELRSKY